MNETARHETGEETAERVHSNAFNEEIKSCFLASKAKGWWGDPENDTPVPKLLLMITEICEATEEIRAKHPLPEIYYKDGKPEGVPIELADLLIRLFDFCGRYNIPLAEAYFIKKKFNESRTFRHGGKAF